jgi:hypothetical protein
MAEGFRVHIYPSRDNSDYQTLADTVPNIIYHSSPDISRVACCDRVSDRPFGRPRVSAPATYRSGTETNTLRLPGITAISTVSRQQFMKHPG